MEVTTVTTHTLEGLQGLIKTLKRAGFIIVYNEANCLIMRRNTEIKVITTDF